MRHRPGSVEPTGRSVQDDRAGDTRQRAGWRGGRLLQLPTLHVDGYEVRSWKDPSVLHGRQLDSTFRGVKNAVGRPMLEDHVGDVDIKRGSHRCIVVAP